MGKFEISKGRGKCQKEKIYIYIYIWVCACVCARVETPPSTPACRNKLDANHEILKLQTQRIRGMSGCSKDVIYLTGAYKILLLKFECVDRRHCSKKSRVIIMKFYKTWYYKESSWSRNLSNVYQGLKFNKHCHLVTIIITCCNIIYILVKYILTFSVLVVKLYYRLKLY